MEEMMRWQIPAFGNWEYYDDLDISHYFDCVGHDTLFPPCFFCEEELFKAPVAMPVKYSYPYDDHCRRKVRKKVSGAGENKRSKKVQEQRKQERVCNATAATPRRRTAPMAVDEDLYKIPPELLYPKRKRKKVLRSLLSGCMGVACIR
ncbi:uncharacterized protein LOC110037817 [Phalaenopsis equestris]|uniref:uncharacterized protein LOC110033013 n=1 Tax=Phalaenopsis equestris TaxID=78828 RepID=UPI0009E2E39E|nr:uncharacterized protein LOC110033013 [Phalaenopsis equestris]XP_020594853.1 uncharacterized protein LOC110034955 [Phalaenopsis equestris]XP_020598199.1 uncharacterized protein LOC110037817 [Phalaenopsis equestris]